VTTCQVTFNRIVCEQDSVEVSPDEVFLVAIPVLGTFGPGVVDAETIGPGDVTGNLLEGHVTGVRRRVRAGDAWIPKNPWFRFDAREGDVLGLALYLYERDDGRLRRALLESFRNRTWPVTVRDDADWARVWSDLLSRITPVDAEAGALAIVLQVLAGVVAVLPAVFKELKKDDLIDARVLTAPLDEATSYVSREVVFEGRDGQASYVVEVTLSRVRGEGGLPSPSRRTRRR